MTGKELVLRAIRFQEVPRVPVAVLDGYLWLQTRHQLSQQDLLDLTDDAYADLVVRTYDELGSDMVFAGAVYGPAIQEAMGGVCDYSKVAAPVSVVKPAITTLEDILRFDPEEVWAKVRRHPVVEANRRRLALISRKLKDEKLLMAFSIAPLSMAMILSGMDRFLTGLYEAPELIEKIMEFGMALSLHQIDEQAAHGATGISMADPVSSVDLISEETFSGVSLPRIRQMTAAVKHHVLPIMLHICGASDTRLEPLKDAGIDIFSFDGGDLKTALETAYGHYALFGNLHTVKTMLNGTPDTVAARAAELIEIAGHSGGFILAPGCDLPAATPIENILAMTGAVRR